MSNEGFEEWDADFLDQLIQVEELALSSTNPTQKHQPQPAYFHLPPPPHSTRSYVGDVSYSPPRELSQRIKEKNVKGLDHSLNGIDHITGTVAPVPITRSTPNAKEQETDNLKRELERVSKKLTHLEQECLDLRKERDKKEEQLKSVISQLEAKDAKVYCMKITDLKDGVHNQEHAAVSLGCQSTNSTRQVGDQINVVVGESACKAVEVQTDKAVESADIIINNDLSASHHCSRKLLSIWDSSFHLQVGRNLVSKLFAACETDFRVLFGYLSLNSSPSTAVESFTGKSSSDVSLQHRTQPVHAAEAIKVSHLYSMLTKINNDMVKLDAMLEALIDLCRLENVIIVCRSLRIMRMVLNQLPSMERKSEKRENIMVEGPLSGNNNSDRYGSNCSGNRSLFHWNASDTSDPVIRLFSAETVFEMGVRGHSSTLLATGVDWVSLFELMHQIVMQNKEEDARLEAVSIMNVILMRSNPYLEREKFGQGLLFLSVSQILRKEAGCGVQQKAVHLLSLLLNCPKLMSMFCSGYKEEGENVGDENSDATTASAFQGSYTILDGLADCVACSEKGTQGLKLQRNAIILLAFLASSGKSGFEILLRHSKRTNFFALILQMLILEMDVEASESVQPSEIFKERTLLIREALIFLNRLVSNPQYSTPVLRVLTNSRDVAFLTIDIANRLSQKVKWPWQPDIMARQMRESEVVDLARVFRKRVFNSLGNNLVKS